MESIFPTSYSTLSALSLAGYITGRYPVGHVHCQFLVRGVGDTYLVDGVRERFILRIYRSEHRTRSQIQGEVELLLALNTAGVSVSYPLPDRSENFIQEFQAAEGVRYGVMFTYAPGRAVPILSEKQLQLLGHHMAGFHNVSSSVRISPGRSNFNTTTTLVEPLELVREAFASEPEDYAWLQEASANVRTRLEQFDSARFSTGYCHFDFLPKNFHFDGDRITLFDFDFLGYGWLVYDIMTFRQQLWLDAHFGRQTQEAADRSYLIFIEAYRNIRPLSDEELAVVPYLSLGWWIFYLGFYTTHDQFYTQLQSPHLKMRITLIRQLIAKYSS